MRKASSSRRAVRPSGITPPNRRDPKEPNLLVTIDERRRTLARDEIARLLDRIGIKDFRFIDVAEGVLGVGLPVDDPKACVQRLQGVIREDPLAFQHTHRWVPVDEWHRAEVRELERFAQNANDAIGPDETWRIQMNRHGSTLDRDRIVNTVANGIENTHVDLAEADKTIMLEAVGDRTAMAVLEPDQHLSVDQVLKNEFLRFEEVG